MHWAIWDCMFKIQIAFEGVISNYPNRSSPCLLHWYIFPLGRPYEVPSDKLGHEVAQTLIEPSATRDRLTAGMYVPRDPMTAMSDAVGVIELALEATVAAEPIEARIRAARKQGRVGAGDTATMAAHAREAGVITAEEHALLQRRTVLRDRAIAVDDFPQDFSVEQVVPATPEPPAKTETLRKAA
jgi:acyl-CoA dehydrogenase